MSVLHKKSATRAGWKLIYLAMCLALLLGAGGVPVGTAQTQPEPPPPGELFTPLDVQQAPNNDLPNGVIRAHNVGFNQGIFERTAGPDQQIRLNLFEDTILKATLVRLERNPSGSLTWIGRLDELPYDSVFLVARDGLLVGSIATAEHLFQVRYLGNGLQQVLEVDPNRFNPGGEDGRQVKMVASDATAPTTPMVGDASDDGALLDLLVVYTAAARSAAGGTAAIQSQIEAAVAYSNQALANSKVNTRLFLSRMQEVVYTESGNDDLDLDRLTYHGDGYLDVVTKPSSGLRDTYHADFVALVVNSGPTYACGLGWVQDPAPNAGFEAYAFTWIKLDCLPDGVTLAHEWGHNMGLRHDWFVDSFKTPYTHAHGHAHRVAPRWKTMMSYNDVCGVQGNYCPTVPYFSNPNLTLGGVPLGVPSGTKSNCIAGSLTPDPTTCDANARSVLNTTRTTGAQFRLSGYTWLGYTGDWNSAVNWSNNRVPRYMDDITIPATPTGGNFPAINGDFAVRNLTIADGASLIMTGGTLSIFGDWEVPGSGVFNGQGGTVVFRSPLDQNIQAGAGTYFNHLQIDSQQVSLAGDVDINGDLTIQNGASLFAGSYTLHVGGDWTDNGASFEQGGSTVILDGANQTIDKPTTTTILLDEPFEEADGKYPCSPVYLPAGWVPEQSVGAGYLGCDQGTTSGAAFAWSDSPEAWLFSPGVYLKPGVTYQIGFKHRLLIGFSKIFAVYLGSGQSSIDMDRLLTSSTANSTAYTTVIESFTVPAAGIYYLGFRAQQAFDTIGVIDEITLSGDKPLTFYNLQIAASGSAALSTVTFVQNNLIVSDGGLLDLGGNPVKVDGLVINDGILKASRLVNGDNVAFLQIMNSDDSTVKYRGLEVDAAADLGTVTVAVSGRGSGEFCPYTGSSVPAFAARCYDITATNNLAATVTLWALTGELNGLAPSSLAAFHNSSGLWSELGARAVGNDGGDYVYAQGNLASFSPLLLGQSGADYNIVLDQQVYLPMVIR